MRPHRRQPTRLPRPWDPPGKNTGVGCHFLPQCMKVKSESEVAQSCPTLSDPMDCSPPGSSVHGIFQARGLEGVPGPSPTYGMRGIYPDSEEDTVMDNKLGVPAFLGCVSPVEFLRLYLLVYLRRTGSSLPRGSSPAAAAGLVSGSGSGSSRWLLWLQGTGSRRVGVRGALPGLWTASSAVVAPGLAAPGHAEFPGPDLYSRIDRRGLHHWTTREVPSWSFALFLFAFYLGITFKASPVSDT